MKNKLVIAIGLQLMLLLASCADMIDGEGPVVTQELNLQTFNSFTLIGSFNVEVNYGVEQKVEVIGQQNIINKLNKEVDSNHWDIKLANGNYNHFDLKVKITLPMLSRAVVNGSGDVRISSAKSNDLVLEVKGSGDMYLPSTITTPNKAKFFIKGSGDIKVYNLKANVLTVMIEGSGNVTLAGVANTSTIRVDGSGNFNGIGLTTKDCHVMVEGSGNVSVDVSEILDVNIKGSGDVYYKGDPSLIINTDGSGRVQRAS